MLSLKTHAAATKTSLSPPSFEQTLAFVEEVVDDWAASHSGVVVPAGLPFARTLLLAVLGDVSEASWSSCRRGKDTASAVNYAGWRGRRWLLWQLLFAYRDRLQAAGLGVEPWPWEYVQALCGKYRIQLPLDLQTVVLVVGWPPLFCGHYDPAYAHVLASSLWHSYPGDSDTLSPSTDSDGHPRRMLRVGGLLNLREDEEAHKLWYVDLCDPVEGRLFSGDVGGDSDSDDADGGSVVTGQETLCEYLLAKLDSGDVTTAS